ncbi:MULTISPECIES: hypothetical protein [unclassified Sphingobacterium]|nr:MULTISPECIES: hypothetical protein [unclassified Sphingobacterium]MCS3556565.1 hypothetical protein [Sphingobacterium sp. JUb21]TCQ99861.1 hypothetical protein EDF66_11386 [Sphingobacterium sp. JUb20]
MASDPFSANFHNFKDPQWKSRLSIPLQKRLAANAVYVRAEAS